MVEEAPLSPHEITLLKALELVGEDELTRLAEFSAWGGPLTIEQARGAIERLKLRGFVVMTNERIEKRARLTMFGDKYHQYGTPEHCILEKIRAGARTIQDAQAIQGYEKKEAGAAFGALKQGGYIKVENGAVSIAKDADFAFVHTQVFRKLAQFTTPEPDYRWDDLPADFRERYEPRKRSGGAEPIELREVAHRFYKLTSEGRKASAGVTTFQNAPAQLTVTMLKDGSWRHVLAGPGFRRYAIAAPPHEPIGRRDPYREFLDATKRKLLALGFEEMTGNHVETEFWDMDALFLPQFHPARQIHDVYFVAEPTHARVAPGSDEARTIEAVAKEHEGKGASESAGWGYLFDRERTKRLVLRSQGTALSARWLARKDLKDPGKYFAMARCFRYDTVDATHAPDFFQVEGIVVSKKTTFRHLLGLLALFAREVAQAREVKYVPAYFPFTEPSVEMHAFHPALNRWVELGGAGVFRPEVTRPHGVTSPVIAWGLGLDRMAMFAYGLKDIRHLFTNNAPDGLGSVRERIAR